MLSNDLHWYVCTIFGPLWPSNALCCQLIFIGSGKNFVPYSTEPLPKPMMTYHEWDMIVYKGTNLSAIYMKMSVMITEKLWLNDAICQHTSKARLAHVMVCCLTAQSHYLNQCWLIISRSCGIHMSTISWEIFRISVPDMSLRIRLCIQWCKRYVVLTIPWWI